jgi:prepilin-type N-terminal cleavage/methylation domain-containing protein
VSFYCARGFTLAEMLVVVAILGIVAVAAVPMLMVSETRLDAASQEVGNALRFAVNEARRTGSYVLVDAETQPGRLLLVKSNAAAARGGDIVDPVTKRAMNIAVTDSAFSTGVQMSASFIAPSGTFPQLLIGPGPAFWAAQSSVVKGTLQPGSGIALALASRTLTVGFDSVSGRVLIP